MKKVVSKIFGISLVVLIFCFMFRMNFVRADTYNQIPLWINVMAGSTISDDQIDNIEKEMDAVFAKAGLNWRVTSVVIDENYPDPDTSEDETGDVRVGDEEDGLYRDGKKEVKDKATGVMTPERASELMSNLVEIMIQVARDVRKQIPEDMIKAVDLEAEMNFVAFSIGVSIDLEEIQVTTTDENSVNEDSSPVE